LSAAAIWPRKVNEIEKQNKLRVTIHMIIVSAVMLATGVSAVDAHPHVFIDNQFRLFFDDQGLAGIQVKWVFDIYFSQMIAEEFDTDRDGTLSPFEVAVVEKDAFRNLAEFDYFVFVKINGKPFKVRWVRDFNATLHAGVLTYEFLIPCHVKAATTVKEIRVSPYDPSYYTMVQFSKSQPVTFESANGFKVDYHIAKNTKESYYYGLVNPYEMVLTFKAAK
jgi:ABC-type uncharacterized transport system substrate-binding protein